MPSTTSPSGPSSAPIPWASYVALGDSFSEGVGDPAPHLPNGVRGWADRVADVLASHRPGLRYANLAIRGRKMAGVLEEQIEPAVALAPDLVSIYAGGNDILRPKVDIDAVVDSYAEGLRALRAAGAHLVVFTGFDLGWAPVFGRLRGRVAVYNELVREAADSVEATVVDFWRMREYRDSHLWDVDRIHMSTLGHQRMAEVVLGALGVALPDAEHVDVEPPRLGMAARRRADLEWARVHAAPWLHRRLTGRSSGDGLTARYPELTVR